MKLGMQVGLGSGHTVLDGDPAPSTERGTAAPTFEIYGRRLCLRPYNPRCLLWTNGWMDQDVTWYGGIDVLDRDPAALPKGAHPQFSAHVYCGQMAG